MRHRFTNTIVGLAAGIMAVLGSGKNADAAFAENTAPPASAPPLLEGAPLLFIDAASPDAADYLLAAHRSHSSHRSHKSHYSSRGGGYSRSAPVYTPPATSAPKSSAPTRSAPAAAAGAAGTAAVAHPVNLVKSIQEGLTTLGYKPGLADGQLGKETKKAIAMFQADQGLTINGEPSQTLLKEIQQEIKKR